MNPKQKKRLIATILIIILLSTAIALTLYALKQNINLFYTPTELLNAHTGSQQNIRLGGYVKKNSVHYNTTGTGVNFIITDKSHDVAIYYEGVLPNLFREEQAVVVTGTMQAPHLLIAHEVLAKHDEKYMPRSVAVNVKKGNSYAT